MSLHGMLFGHNPAAGELLGILNLSIDAVGRFRDAWLEKDGGAGIPRIAVYTRNGGGNREHYDDETQPGVACNCTGCIIKYRLPRHPNYLYDADDKFDCTYATVYFSIPEPFLSALKEAMVAGEIEITEKVDMSERWLEAIEALKTAPIPPKAKTP